MILLIIKNINGIKYNMPVRRPASLWVNSTQKIDLNSSKLILLFIYIYSGDCLYLLNSSTHSSSLKGGRIPLTGFHSVIDNPESVRRVKPPMKIMQITDKHMIFSQRARHLFCFV